MSATIRQAAGSLVVVGLNGTELTALERAWLRLVRPGGVILFKRNVTGAQQTRDLLEEATGFCCSKALRCVDVEGGTVNRLRDALAAIAVGAGGGCGGAAVAKKPALARAARRVDCACGEGLRLQHDAGAGGRSGSARSRRSAGVARRRRDCSGRDRRMRATFWPALAAQGVVGCGKHFPGLGGASGRFAFRDAGDPAHVAADCGTRTWLPIANLHRETADDHDESRGLSRTRRARTSPRASRRSWISGYCASGLAIGGSFSPTIWRWAGF